MESHLLMTAIICGCIVLGLAIVVGLPVVLGVRHSRGVRELEHAERMKALELGRPWPPGVENPSASSEGSPGQKIAIAVPLGALGIAWLASTPPWNHGEISQIIWGAAGLVAVAGVICGTLLVLRQPSGASGSQRVPVKPYQHDPDEFDVAGRRG